MNASPALASTSPEYQSSGPNLTPLPHLPGITLTTPPLSRGPISSVYRGWDRVHRHEVIVKVQSATEDQVAADRFRREAAVMARLRHPNIVALYQFLDGDPAALVLEYVPGQTLADLIAVDGWLSPDRAARVIEDVAAALDCVHVQGIIHRDVKPSNILIPKRGPARLSDFGVAHIDENTPLTVMGDILGTIEYASPEQVHGNEVPDARSDVYSLAAVAYFALTGTPPFRAADNSSQAQLSVMHRQVFAEPPPLRFHREDLSPEIEQAVLRGLAKAPASRYPSAGQFAATLRAAVEAGTGAPEQRALAAGLRRKGVLADALAVAALLLVGLITLWKTGHFTRPQHSISAAPSQYAGAFQQAHSKPKSPSSAPLPPKTSLPSTPLKQVAQRPHPTHKGAAVNRLKSLQTASTEAASKASVVIAQKSSPKPISPKPASKRVFAIVPKPKFVKAASHTAFVHPKLRHKNLVALRRVRPTHSRVIVAVVRSKPLSAHKAGPPVRQAVAHRKAWLYIYAKQNISPLASKSRLASIRPLTVLVDGYRASDLAAGQWTSLPAGRHVITFIPDPRSGFAPATKVKLTLAPGAHVRKQVLLSLIPNAPASLASIRPAPANPVKQTPGSAVPAALVSRDVGWYSVSGWISRPLPGRKPELVRTSASWVKVDGHPVMALALGQWAQLPSGQHVVTFQPTSGVGVGPKTWTIELAPQAHLEQKIPLPAVSEPAIPPHLRNP